MKNLDEKLASLPTEPGVYLMKGTSGEVIYVGKAANLRNRVRSYFQDRTGDSRAFIPLLDRLLGDIEVVLVGTEKEALLLENELIKKHQPRFNVKLRDDKNFICLRLDERHPYPRLEVVRRFKNDGARYFGPYASAASIRESMRIINRFFGLRTCSDHVLETRRRPCLLYQIGRCPAPCVFPIPSEQYHRSVEEVLLFLEGRADELTGALKARMKSAAAGLRFEEAARVRDQLYAIERSLERQKIAHTDPVDQDVFGLYREGDRLLFYALYVRRGRITGGQAFPLTGQEFPTEELLLSFVNLYYDNDNLVPKEVLLPLGAEEAALEALAEVLTEKRGDKVRVLVPRRGEKVELVQMAGRNAEAAFQDRKRSKEEVDAILEKLKDRLHLARPPRRIECYDISHFQGATIVASQVASADGELDKARYRRFRIKSVASQDDFASMYEVITRRLRRGLKEGDLPDLLVIDGGKGQLASAHAAMKDLKVEKVDVVGLAKSRELEAEVAAPLVGPSDAPAERSPERIFLVGKRDPIVLAQNSAELFMLTRLRDEAHRFAITYQQKLMRRRNFKSVLEDIPGVGDGRKKALLRHFGSLKRVRQASIEELAAVEGVGASVAERIHGFLHPEGEEEGAERDPVREASLEDAALVEVNELREEGREEPS
ncbi:MAG TPA: excinuclease ABC subunit UvrC [Myxococcaceae bacterium]|nr:excinuclease ABC subunit UvrC [Myxococcaceae bacterium]